MSKADNKKSLQRILYRERFEQRDLSAEGERYAQEADARTLRKYATLKKWLQIRESISSILSALNKKIALIGAEVRVSENVPHKYLPDPYESIGRGRLDFYMDGKKTTRSLEADLSANGTAHLYMYLPKETKRLKVNLAEIDRTRIEALLIEFVDLATQDDFPRCP